METTIRIKPNTKVELDHFRQYKSESYDELVRKLIYLAKISEKEPKLSQKAILEIKEAREKILQELKNNNLIVDQKKISHVVNVHDKCGTEIEFLSSKQWFVKYLDLKKQMLKWGKEITLSVSLKPAGGFIKN